MVDDLLDLTDEDQLLFVIHCNTYYIVRQWLEEKINTFKDISIGLVLIMMSDSRFE